MPFDPISDSVRLYQDIRARLLSDDPDIDDTTLADTLEGETDLQERLVRIANAVVEAEDTAAILAERIKAFYARKKRYEARAERLRSLLLWALGEAGLSRIVAPDLTLSVGKPRVTVVITNIEALPMKFVEYDPVPLKAEIRAALEAGLSVPGASLNNAPPTLTIRTK